MSREIKFRRPYIRSDGSFSHFSYWGPNLGHTAFTPPGSCTFADAMPDEQFTGLKDKNNVEIHEGDVVRILYTDWPSKTSDDPRTIAEYMKDIALIGKIIFRDAEFCIAFQAKNYPGEWNCGSIFPGTHGCIEVIGNQHEHPHLIK